MKQFLAGAGKICTSTCRNKMVMSQSERLSAIQKLYTKKWVPRNKPRDASEITYMNQARAAAGTPLITTVYGKVADPSVTGLACCAQVTSRGKGMNGEYLGILMGKQGCAICSGPDPNVNLGITIPAKCLDQQVPPFTQQDLSNSYVVCTSSGFNKYFPEPDTCTSGCPTARVVFPS